ncbi:Mucin-4 [Exaiptasia diaphana]|nr:Mucin-4 [Exaiptasia diaphana]
MHKKFYITEDGYLAVGRRIKSSPRQLKLLNLDIISIFWAWTNYRYDTSNVTYYELSQSDDNAASILSRINKLVINSTNEANFDTQWAMVITWSNMSPYWYLRRIFYKSPYSKETNTFQVVIAVAGRKTVVIFLYEHGGMTWKRGQLRKATVGFSFKKRRNGYQVDGSFNDDILNIDEQTFTDPSGKKRQGIIVRVFKDAKPDVSPEENCLNWILKENKKNQGWLNRLIECPSTERQFWIMRWLFRRMTNIRDRTCYITRRRDKSCCYDTDSGALITSPYIKAGRALGPNDGNAFNWCCIESKRYCESFSQLRPADSDEQRECRGFCSWLRNIWTIRIRRTRRIRRRPFRRGFMWGDPHITTLDGFKYTFNGLGEYVLLKTTDSEDFNAIHARTKRSKNKDGSLAKATVFSGFAMRSSKNTTVQVLLDGNMAGNLSITTVNKSMNCQPFGIADIDEHPIEGFTLSNNSNALVVVYDSGLTVEITPGMDLLQFGLSIPTSNFENRTEGLLGKLNEDPNDDLFLRNGTAVPLNSTEKEIFEYGKTWVVQDDERLFVNSSCDKLPVYVDVNFRPLFLSDVQNNITAEMRETCKNNTECLLDYFVTGNKAFAQATLKFEEENEKVKKILVSVSMGMSK